MKWATWKVAACWFASAIAIALASCGGGGDPTAEAPSPPTHSDDCALGGTDPASDMPSVDPGTPQTSIPLSATLSATAASSMEVVLSWQGSWKDGSLFAVARSLGGANWLEIEKVPASASTYSDPGLFAGKNYRYRLDLGNGTYSNTVPVSTPFPAIAAGEYHTLYIEDGKKVRARGKYADQTVVPASIPAFDPDVIAIAAGAQYSLALTTDGTLWAWGQWNQDRSSSIPAEITKDVVAIAGGLWHSLAVTKDGKVWTSGRNVWGTDIDSMAVGSLTDIAAVAAGNGHSLALTHDGKVLAWGYNTQGQLGDGTYDYRSSAVPVKIDPTNSLSEVVAVAAGYDHGLALKADGTVWAWGYHGFGIDGSYGSSRTAIQVTDLTDVCAVAAFGFHSVVLRKDGTVWTWGLNTAGALGTGSSAPAWSSVPIPVSISGVTAIAAGYYHSLARTRDGKVWGWGSGAQGQLSTSLANDQPPFPFAP